MIRGWKAVAVLGVTAVIGSMSGAVAEPWTIKGGWGVAPGHLAPLIEALGKREPALFKHLGKSYVMQTTRFQGTTPQIQAEAIGEIGHRRLLDRGAGVGGHQRASRRAGRRRCRRRRDARIF